MPCMHPGMNKNDSCPEGETVWDGNVPESMFPSFFCKCCLKDAVSNSDILHIFSVDMVIRYSWGMSNFAT